MRLFNHHASFFYDADFFKSDSIAKHCRFLPALELIAEIGTYDLTGT